MRLPIRGARPLRTAALLLCCGLWACSSSRPTATGASDAGVGDASDGGADDGALDASADSEAGPPGDADNGGAPLITYDSLATAYDAIQNGAMDVAVSVDGREHYVIMKAANGDETDELTIDGAVVYRVTDTGGTSHTEQDQNGTGKVNWWSDVTRGATPNDRQVVITSDPSDTGSPTGRTTMTQTAATPDTVHVKVESLTAGAWVVVEETDTPVVQAMDSPVVVDSISCGALTSQIQSGMEDAITEGLQEMQKYKVNDIVNGIVALLADRGLKIACDSAVAGRGDCAEASILDTLTASRIGGLPNTRVSIAVAPSAGCVQKIAFFHELIHLVTGLVHKPPQKPTDKEWKAEDRVYSCADVAFESQNATKPTTQCECATCLKTTMDDPRCSGFDKCPADIAITSANCVSTGPCPCFATTGTMDQIVLSGTAHAPPGSFATMPNPTGVDTNTTVDCDEWAWSTTTVIGGATACVRGQDSASRIEWSDKALLQTICQCNPAGLQETLNVSLWYGPKLLAYDMKTVTCP